MQDDSRSTHYHGFAYFEEFGTWQLVNTSDNYRRCSRRLERQMEEPRWAGAVDTMVRKCFRRNADCPYWHGEDWVEGWDNPAL